MAWSDGASVLEPPVMMICSPQQPGGAGEALLGNKLGSGMRWAWRAGAQWL